MQKKKKKNFFKIVPALPMFFWHITLNSLRETVRLPDKTDTFW